MPGCLVTTTTLGRGGVLPSGQTLVGVSKLLFALLGPVPGSPGCWMVTNND